MQAPAANEVRLEGPVLSGAEAQIVELFAGSVQVLGLPKSLGQIYGFLFAQSDPQTMDQIVRGLGISLGSASQGLKALKRIGAVHSIFLPGTRRDAFMAELELKKLLGGFIREQLLPHLQNGKTHLQNLEKHIPEIQDKEHRAALVQRLKKLKEWQKKAGRMVPLVELVFTKL